MTMGAFLVYIIKVVGCTMLFYLPYSLLLRNEKWHAVNRLMLLGIVVGSFIIPLMSVGSLGWSLPSLQMVVERSLQDISPTEEFSLAGAGESRPLWPLMLVSVYFIGVCFMAILRIYQLFSLYRFIPKGCLWKENRKSGVIVYCHAGEVSPFSWMHRVVISESDYESEAGCAILMHETAHAEYRHSYDTLLMAVAEVLMWFNPIVWLMEMDLRCIHEFQADDYVLNRGVNAKTYQMYLIKKAVGARLQSFANGLNQSTLKKRIAMMYKKSSKWAALKYMYVLPVGAIATVAFAHSEFENRVINPLSPIAEVEVTDFSRNGEENDGFSVHNLTNVFKENQSRLPLMGEQLTRDTIFEVVQENPVFPGGATAMMKFLADHTKYPKEAIEEGLQGRVVVQMIIRSDGSISSPKVVKSAGAVLDAEALRVVKLMPKWIPGKNKGKAVNCKFSVPVMFRLS